MTDSKAFDVAVVGNVGVDTNVYIEGRDIDLEVESNFTENMDCVGQAGGYAARGYAQLRKKTAFAGYVGNDHNGQHIRDEFAADGIDTTALLIDLAGTGRSVNFMYKDGRRKNFYDGKDHMNLEPDIEVCSEVLAAAKFAHFSIPNWARKLLPVAKNHDLTIACDIQDIVSPDDPYRRDFIEQADIIFFSAVNQADPAELMATFLEQKPEQIIVVGLGAEGCALGTQEGIRFFPPVEMDQPVIDTNGAGDSLAVGFLSSYLLDEFPLEDSVLRGQIAARYACTQRGSSSSLITQPQLNQHFLRLQSSR